MTTTDHDSRHPGRRDHFGLSPRRRRRIRNIISADEAARFRDAATAATRTAEDNFTGSAIFNQYVNIWRQDDVLRELTWMHGSPPRQPRWPGCRCGTTSC